MWMQDPEFIALKSRISELQRANHELQRRLERSASDQKRLEERVRLIEDTPSFRFMRAVGRLLGRLFGGPGRLLRLLRRFFLLLFVL